jgi:ribosome-binding protein aMBF1 (putative translation factor)
MPRSACCIVEGCQSLSHAKGYCRRHYGQIWRRGTIYNETPKENTTAPESDMRRDDRLRALEREFKKAQQMYDVVVGYQGRIKWRREMEAVQHEIRKINEQESDIEQLETVSSNDSTPMLKQNHKFGVA